MYLTELYIGSLRFKNSHSYSRIQRSACQMESAVTESSKELEENICAARYVKSGHNSVQNALPGAVG